MLNNDDPGSKIVLKIAEILQKNPHENIVKIYKVSKRPMFIDYQLLDLEYCINSSKQTNYIDNIRKGLHHLHTLNIVYIDLKNNLGDNIGYDCASKTYRIYDFDVSGILKK